jgi:L-erythro-3,5-diaminohexanoate dehydrogenase
LTPLRLDEIGPVDAASRHIPVQGRAIISATAPWTRLSGNLPLPVVMAVLDVCGAPAHTRARANAGDHVLVIGAGRAGLLSLAAAREAVGDHGRVTALDLSGETIEMARAAGLCDDGVVADASNPVETIARLAEQSVPAADLTVFVADAPRCELTAVLATRPEGTVLFFSMATSFTAAALGAEGLSSSATLLIGNGYTCDRGRFAIDLVSGSAPLRELLTWREHAAG